MPLTQRNENTQIRAGTWTSAGLAGFEVVNWSNGADAIVDNQLVAPWSAPHSAVPPEYSRIALMADGSVKADGFLRGKLLWDYLTFGQLFEMVNNRLFPSGVYSALLSFGLFDIYDSPVYVNATGYRPVVGQDMEPAPAGWRNVVLRYDYGVYTS